MNPEIYRFRELKLIDLMRPVSARHTSKINVPAIDEVCELYRHRDYWIPVLTLRVKPG
ncbi:hypothetical protein ABVF61_04900 [Roseibium sp. HPY-6]|uniref:hypothetical protein n=1 Tax=Roseibium sp. HPY-6 TaxID=3229852 RepID=UPI00338F5D1F